MMTFGADETSFYGIVITTVICEDALVNLCQCDLSFRKNIF